MIGRLVLCVVGAVVLAVVAVSVGVGLALLLAVWVDAR